MTHICICRLVSDQIMVVKKKAIKQVEAVALNDVKLEILTEGSGPDWLQEQTVGCLSESLSVLYEH